MTARKLFSYLRVLPLLWCGCLERVVPAQVSSSSSDHGSKLRVRPKIALVLLLKGTLKAISHAQKFANPTLNSTVHSTQNLRIEFNLPSDMEVGVEENTLNPVDFSRQS
ncbi:hypothetical protein AVEN_233455-1 [Araneus ventricosus]|uniref:Uncharacterized protein n=1 Tax=Araneus ventricosus TaxID=182803 RepID=A0A4Y2W3T6_ARAVE|nr:hypothetical protein AVEN_233455-1 [Araneus ventricosus]